MIKIRQNVFIAFLALFAFFEPVYMSSLPYGATFYNCLSLLTFVLVFFVVIYQQRWYSLAPLLIVLGEFLILIFTFLNNGQIKSETLHFMMLCTLVALVECYRHQFVTFLDALMLHFECCIYINLASLIFFPESLFSRENVAYGFTHEWFLGSRNSFISWLLPGLVVALLYRCYHRKSKRWVFLTIGIFATQFFQTSSTLIVSSVLVLFLSLTPYVNRLFRPLIGFAVSMVLEVLIVVFNQVNFLSPIIVGILGKSLTFTNRTTIWENALHSMRLFTGYGKLYPNQTAQILGNFQTFLWQGATHAHNQLLNLGFQAGIILIIITLVTYAVAFWKLERLWDNPIARVYSFGLFAYIVAGYTEITNHILLQLLIILPLVADKTIIEPHSENE